MVTHAGPFPAGSPAAAPPGASENEEGFFVSSCDSAMREKGALNEAARRRLPRPPAMGNDRSRGAGRTRPSRPKWATVSGVCQARSLAGSR